MILRMGSEKRIVVLAAMAALALVTGTFVRGLPAHGASCPDSRIVIYSQQQALEPALNGYFVPDVNKDFWCYTDGPDFRVILPGSTMVMVRVFGGDPGPLTLSGIINATDIPMSFGRSPFGASWFDSPWIPLDPTRTGTLTATLDPMTGSNTYHTVL